MQFYQGPSAINGRPIISVFAGMVIPSANVKTGPVIQQFILSDEGVAPHQINSEQSEAICGSCPLQPSKSGGCYVTRFRSSYQVFKQLSKYPEFKATRLRGRVMRLGADGDPTAIPFDYYAPVFKNSKVIIGCLLYTSPSPRDGATSRMPSSA